MNLTETRELLRQRRLLTGAAYNDDTVSAWHEAFKRDTFDDCCVGLVAATRTRAGHVMVADIAANLPHQPDMYRPPEPADDELISLDEYLRRLRRRADSGSFDARRELLTWSKHADRTRELKSWTRHPANPDNDVRA